MKSLISRFFAAAVVLSFVACNNQEEPAKPAPTETATPAATTPAKPADPKTDISVGPDGAEVKTGDVKVKVTTKDTTRR